MAMGEEEMGSWAACSTGVGSKFRLLFFAGQHVNGILRPQFACPHWRCSNRDLIQSLQMRRRAAGTVPTSRQIACLPKDNKATYSDPYAL